MSHEALRSEERACIVLPFQRALAPIQTRPFCLSCHCRAEHISTQQMLAHWTLKEKICIRGKSSWLVIIMKMFHHSSEKGQNQAISNQQTYAHDTLAKFLSQHYQPMLYQNFHVNSHPLHPLKLRFNHFCQSKWIL